MSSWDCGKCGCKANYGTRTACRGCKKPRHGGAAVTPDKGADETKELRQRLRETEKKLKEAEARAQPGQTDDGAAEEGEKLREQISHLEKCGDDPAINALIAQKRDQLAQVQARRRAGKPTHAHLRELEERIEKKQRAITKEMEEVTELEGEVRAAMGRLATLRQELSGFQAEKAKVSQELTAAPSSDAERAAEVMRFIDGIAKNMPRVGETEWGPSLASLKQCAIAFAGQAAQGAQVVAQVVAPGGDGSGGGGGGAGAAAAPALPPAQHPRTAPAAAPAGGGALAELPPEDEDDMSADDIDLDGTLAGPLAILGNASADPTQRKEACLAVARVSIKKAKHRKRGGA